jgi:hypothetical protein
MRLRFMNDPPPPPVEWVAEGLIQRGTLAVLAGAPGAAKSALMQNMVAADILGDGQWLGMQVQHAWPAMWLAFESAESTRRRLAALDPERRARVCVASGAPSLADDRAFDEIERALDQAAERFGEPVKVLVVDALASAMRGYDENSGRDVGAALGALLGLIDNRGLTSIVLSHTGKGGDNRTRGHSSVDADAASVLAVTGTGAARRLHTVKQRDSEPVEDIQFDVIDRNGAPYTVRADKGGAAKSRPSSLPSDARLVLAALNEIGGAATLNVLRDRAVIAFGDRSTGALREAWRKARNALVERQLLLIDGENVTVTKRHQTSLNRQPVTLGSVTESVTKRVSIRDAGDAVTPCDRPLN